MQEILIQNLNKRIKMDPHKNLMTQLMEHQIFIDHPCNGKGTCRKCRVRIVKGDVTTLTETEKQHLSSGELAEGIRLACLIYPLTEMTVETLQKEAACQVLTQGALPEFEYHPSIEKKKIQLQRPSLENQTSMEESLLKAAKAQSVDWELLHPMPPYQKMLTTVCRYGHCYQLEEGDTADQLYGIAVDIGTTTIAASLVNIRTGAELGVTSMINPQHCYGSDVLTRITYQIENPETAVQAMQKTLVGKLEEAMIDLCQTLQINPAHVYEMTVAANTTMLHTLLGISAESIGISPYAPAFITSKDLKAAAIGFQKMPAMNIYCLPSVSAYIGADIVAGVFSCQLQQRKETRLLIDIGTNGEMVLSHEGKLSACSCAAGPALEGMNISNGMRAAKGAIEDIEIDRSEIKLKVIENAEPVGLCGSGILAATKELLRSGMVKKNGAFIKKTELEEDHPLYQRLHINGKKREFLIAEGNQPIYITQSDIRQVQLAKGALLSGFYALLDQAGITIDQLDEIIVAGQFGAHLSADHLVETGILPRETKEKISYAGNTSKTGAYMALMAVDARKTMENLAQEIQYKELSTHPDYEKLFRDSLEFPKLED
ncbi:Uncharacterized 2Fe-2 and 4Fe-4S clusters-containing protein, contains DUF4445 domain [Tindallia magadiensis]|uniref:Uncharacterized 2Fe-2 and 4Fe-4S clusters-containing protein, contains DUF4445 domain n=1 Tax=Tindallia magadiensis TaxID=69895 RepID=A0A1I3CV66_9FIRM|nr:ASKHA domain-containing protein [Tindallia magadiensis]SFH78323.1 Uncharacterized 2Fe-2 and 4Fe-4S clusters-containing protein, contains DUF4445 domain [Tindallia magadiensis]